MTIEPFCKFLFLACAAIMLRALSLTDARAWPSAQLIEVSALPLLAAVVDQA